MSQSANVRSVESIHDFKVSLVTFAEDARNALSSMEMELRRTRDWLLRDQLSHWQSQFKRRTELVSIARTELHRRRLSQQGSDAVSDSEQKENLKIAIRRLEEAEDKLKQIKKWAPVLEHAISEYHATSQPLGDRLTGSLVNSMTLLDRMVASLESYAALTAPSVGEMPSTSGSSGTSSTAKSAAPATAKSGDAPDSAEAAVETASDDAASTNGQTDEHPEPTGGPKS